MTTASLHADCAHCAALCCVTPSFDRSEDFAIDKPSGVPCPHLGSGNQCRIYTHREQTGFKGCINHDCFGAGQRVTQDIFEGRSWRDHPELLPAMVVAFSAMREVHRLLVLLNEAANLTLSKVERRHLDQFLNTLVPQAPWTVESLAAFEESDLSKRVQNFLQTLKHHFGEPAQPT